MSDDDQALAEQFDEDATGDNTVNGDMPVISEDSHLDMPPDEPLGLPFADADVTDESLADRHEREEPEVWEQETVEPAYDAGLGGEAADEQLEQVIELGP